MATQLITILALMLTGILETILQLRRREERRERERLLAQLQQLREKAATIGVFDNQWQAVEAAERMARFTNRKLLITCRDDGRWQVRWLDVPGDVPVNAGNAGEEA